GQRGAFAIDEVQEELPVPLRAGQARVYDAHSRGRPPESGSGDLAQHAAMHVSIANDAAPADIVAARFELRLHEDEGLPAGAGASFSPPRETYRGSRSTTSSVDSSTGSPALAWPGTRPAMTSACAWARLSARPRSTSSTSRRLRTRARLACRGPPFEARNELV